TRVRARAAWNRIDPGALAAPDALAGADADRLRERGGIHDGGVVFAALAARIDPTLRERRFHIGSVRAPQPGLVQPRLPDRHHQGRRPRGHELVEQVAGRAAEQRLDAGAAGCSTPRLGPGTMLRKDQVSEYDVGDAVAGERPERGGERLVVGRPAAAGRDRTKADP